MKARIRVVVILVALGFPVGSAAQMATVQDTSLFRPLDLPAASRYRSGSGRPGPDYWQQRADYRLQATLDVEHNLLTGSGSIRYRNNSPDSLAYLWMYLDQNICAPESITNTLNQPPLAFAASVFDFSCQGFRGGLTLVSLQSGGVELSRQIYGTTMRVDLPRALPPGGELMLDVSWSFPVPAYGAGRMGRDGSLYEIAWWYPRMAVYDDVKGWNHEPYIGSGEFYLEYGSFDVSITLPATYVIAATGTLQNPDDVLTPEQRNRLARARVSDEPVSIITADEAGKSTTRPSAAGTLTWRFHADNVRDFAFATAPDLRWDAVNWDGILIQTMYRQSADRWPEAIRMARQVIRHFSEQWFRYPYPQATTFEGPIEGMEYPMLTFVPNLPTREDTYWTLAHEFGHEWFPMVVGSNERLYPWMDEGFNTFIDIGVTQDYFRGQAFGDTVASIPLHIYGEHAIPGVEQPLMTRPVESRDLFWTAYRKPSLMLHLLRTEVLGRDRFDFAFRQYIRAWAFRHPTPSDFFRVMRDASGMDLDWFWRGWLYTTARLDQSVDAIRDRDGGGSEVSLTNRGTMVMPAELKLTFADGTTQTVRLPVEMWNLGRTFTYRVPGTKSVVAAELDPRHVFPDVDRGNDVRRR
jgi:Peptidase family M1 domain